jgi:hypothetical protein
MLYSVDSQSYVKTIPHRSDYNICLWAVLLEDDEVWGFGRYEKNGVPIEGMTYFKLGRRP